MKNVNTVQMEELSKDQIAAARARRLKERYAESAWDALNLWGFWQAHQFENYLNACRYLLSSSIC